MTREEQIEIYEHLHMEMQQQLSQYTDVMVEGVLESLRARGIASQIVISTLADDTPYKFLKLLPTADSPSSAAKRMHRIQQRFGINSIEFDPMELINSGFGGIYYSSSSTVKLRMAPIGEIINHDLLSGLSLHEFGHGVFQAMRRQGRDSIYHVVYKARGDMPLSPHNHGYTKYASAEELYNYLNEPYWMVRRLNSSRIWQQYEIQFLFADLIDHMNFVPQLMEQSRLIAGQTRSLAQKMQKATTSEKLAHISFWDEKMYTVHNAVDAKYFRIMNPETMHEITLHIPQHLKQKLKAFDDIKMRLDYEAFMQFDKNYYQTPMELREQVESAVKQTYVENFNQTFDEYMRYLDDIHEKHLKITDIADAELPRLQSQAKAIDDKIENFFKQNEDAEVLTDAAIQAEILAFRRTLSDFAKKIRSIR